MTKMWLLVTACVFAGASPTLAQSAAGLGAVTDLYEQHCVACHGQDLAGGLGSSLIDDEWAHGGDDASIGRVITDGLPDAEMVGFGDLLSEDEVRSLVIYIREARHLALLEAVEAEAAPENGVFRLITTTLN